MASRTRGQVDFGEDGFVVQFDYSRELVAHMKTLQRQRFDRDRRRWVIDPHWPSVHRLFQIALEHGFDITPPARAEQERLQAASYELEYSVDAVHDHCGAMWFVCKTGDDDELRRKVRDIERAYWDDNWWVPTDWDVCCKSLRAIVEADDRITLSNAAMQLLYEEDVSDRFIRAQVPERTPQVSLQALDGEPSESVGAVRKPRVSTHGANAPAEPANERKHSA